MNPLSQEMRSRSPMRARVLSGGSYLFLALGLLSLGYAGFVFAGSHAYQTLELKKFKQAGRLAEPRVLAEGDVIGELQVTRLRLDAIVVQGDAPADLRRAVGHLANSALPGEWGNIALAGHRDTFFRPLRNIRRGDKIQFTTREGSFEYLVSSIEIVAPNDIRVLEPSIGRDLTFITCFPFHFVGPAPKRFVVHAREVGPRLHDQLANAPNPSVAR